MTTIINKINNTIVSKITTNEEYISLIIDMTEYFEDNSKNLKISQHELHQLLSHYTKNELTESNYIKINEYNISEKVIIINFETNSQNEIDFMESTLNLADYIDEIQVSDFHEYVSSAYFDEIYNSPLSISYEDLPLINLNQQFNEIPETWFDDKNNMIYSLQ